jgi:hypothetical protein
MKLLDLAELLKSHGEVPSTSDLAPIVKATSEAYLKVRRVIPPPKGSSRDSAWPLVEMNANLDAFNVRGADPFAIRQVLTPTDWLGFLICSQAAEVGELPLPTLDDDAAPEKDTDKKE